MNFLENIESLPQAILHDRRVRRRVIDVLLLEINSSQDATLTCDNYAQSLLDCHDNARSANAGVCRYGNRHWLLRLASVLLFRRRSANSRLACRLLTSTTVCENSVESFLEAAIFGMRVTFLLSGSKSDFDSDDDCLAFAEYFLAQAARENLQLTLNFHPHRAAGWQRSYRVVDAPLPSYDLVTPVCAAVSLQRVDAVRLFLKYGAQLDGPDVRGECIAGGCLPLARLCCHLNDQVASHVERARPYSETAIECLMLLLGAMPRHRLVLTSSEDSENYEYALHYTVAAQRQQLFFHTRAFVSSLKHMCRCTIRERLAVSGSLPHRIHELSLPEQLLDYVARIQADNDDTSV